MVLLLLWIHQSLNFLLHFPGRTAQILTTSLELLGFSVTTLHSLLDHKRRVAHLGMLKLKQIEDGQLFRRPTLVTLVGL